MSKNGTLKIGTQKLELSMPNSEIVSQLEHQLSEFKRQSTYTNGGVVNLTASNRQIRETTLSDIIRILNDVLVKETNDTKTKKTPIFLLESAQECAFDANCSFDPQTESYENYLIKKVKEKQETQRVNKTPVKSRKTHISS